MDFLATLHTDVKLLLVAGALALFGGLVSGSKKKEYRYVLMCGVLLAVAGYRYQHEQAQDALAAAGTRAVAASPAKDLTPRH